MNEKKRMKPLDVSHLIRSRGEGKTDPIFREITAGLQSKIQEILRDPDAWGSCCVQGCCVSWCCVQLH